MPNRKFLEIGNPRKIQRCLDNIVDSKAISNIEIEIEKHAQKLFDLSLKHYRVASQQKSHNWRQKISRFYYAAYAASKMVRFYVNGEHSTDAKDHKKVGILPDDFPKTATYKNLLETLREDRNTCDYDHVAKASDLVQKTTEAEILVTNFLNDTKKYLAQKGFRVRGKI